MGATTDLVQALKDAHKETVWLACSTKVGEAIDTYMKAVKITTKVNGAGVGPAPAFVPYTGEGTGQGTLSISGAPALISACVAAYTNPTWAGIGSQIAMAIVAYVPTGIVNTEVTGFLGGTGKGVLVLAPNPQFPLDMDLLMTTPGNSWDKVGEDMADLIKTEFSKITLNTIDLGPTPPTSWTGTGVGTLVWD